MNTWISPSFTFVDTYSLFSGDCIGEIKNPYERKEAFVACCQGALHLHSVMSLLKIVLKWAADPVGVDCLAELLQVKAADSLYRASGKIAPCVCVCSLKPRCIV